MYGATTLTAQTIFGGEGNDIINFGAAGFTATLTAGFVGEAQSGGNLSATISQSAGIAANGNVISAMATGGIGGIASGSVTLTSVQAISTLQRLHSGKRR